MHAHVVRELFEQLHAAHTVTVTVKARRERRHTQLTGHRTNDAAAHAALRRHTHLGRPVTRRVIHAAREHDAQYLTHHSLRNHLLTRHRMYTIVRQSRRHQRQILDRHHQRALAGITLHRHGRVTGQDAVAAQHVRNRVVAVRVLQLRLVHALIHRQATARKRRQTRNDALHTLALSRTGRTHQRMGGNRARVNHRVQRLTGAVLQGQLVERLTGRLHAHLRKHVIIAAVREREGVHERLRNRLNSELHIGVTGGVLLTINHGDRRGKLVRVHGGKFRNVVCQLTGGIRSDRLEGLGQVSGNR